MPDGCLSVSATFRYVVPPSFLQGLMVWRIYFCHFRSHHVLEGILRIGRRPGLGTFPWRSTRMTGGAPGLESS